jgi:predicted oxidoreductase (fatty acid repression mutant protein)
MAEFAEVVRNRRMTRAFDPAPVDPAVIDDMVDLASRAPSAGKAQGWHLVVLEGDDTSLFWDTTLPAVRRDSFRWQQLLSAPVIALPLADSKAYIDR